MTINFREENKQSDFYFLPKIPKRSETPKGRKSSNLFKEFARYFYLNVCQICIDILQKFQQIYCNVTQDLQLLRKCFRICRKMKKMNSRKNCRILRILNGFRTIHISRCFGNHLFFSNKIVLPQTIIVSNIATFVEHKRGMYFIQIKVFSNNLCNSCFYWVKFFPNSNSLLLQFLRIGRNENVDFC